MIEVQAALLKCAALMLCVAAVLIGLTMGLCSFCVDVGLETLNNWKFGAVKQVHIALHRMRC